MVLRPEPVAAALAEIRRPGSTVILLDAAGETFRQARARGSPARPDLIFVCPRYEGVDERICGYVDLELSIGDYVLTGGELAALVVIDAVVRLLPGAIDAALDRRGVARGGVPRVPALHAAAVVRGPACRRCSSRVTTARSRRWREREALRRTLERRPDLLSPPSATSAASGTRGSSGWSASTRSASPRPAARWSRRP